MAIITELFAALTSIVTGFISVLVAGFNGIITIFWTTGADGGLTVMGVLLLIGLGMGLVFFVFKFIKSLIQGA